MAKLFTITGIAICVIFGLFCFSFAQESLTITTYYPSPYGSYNELRANQMSIGAGYQATAIPGNSLIVQGNVGIGVTAPAQALVVAGRIQINTGGMSGRATCWKPDNTIGYCSTVVDASGACTCN